MDEVDDCRVAMVEVDVAVMLWRKALSFVVWA